MEKYYSIGEVAEILGVTVPTLRHYDKIGLLTPAYINPESGYRYYSYDQFSFVERVRYLQSFGLSLDEIREALAKGSGQGVLPYLKKQYEDRLKELRKLQENADALRWYIDYYKYPLEQHFPEIPYKRVIGDRYCLRVPIRWNMTKKAADRKKAAAGQKREDASQLTEAALKDMGQNAVRMSKESSSENEISPPIAAALKLRRLKSGREFSESVFLRQNGAVLDYEQVMNRIWRPKEYFVYLKSLPEGLNPSDASNPSNSSNPSDPLNPSNGSRLSRPSTSTERVNPSNTPNPSKPSDASDLASQYGSSKPSDASDLAKLPYSSIRHIPAGEFLCFQGYPLADDWNPGIVRELLAQDTALTKPAEIIADEYESDLTNFHGALYEFQIRIG